MRVIGGRLKGIRLSPPKGLPVRPTTDLAKEALFNILENRFDIGSANVLDLFSGTGNISIEFASRGARSVTAVDRDFGCIKYLKTVQEQYSLTTIKAVRADVFKFIGHETDRYDIIFADPPYDLPQITAIAGAVFRKSLLNADGLLIIEHPSMKKLSNDPHFLEQRVYGSSSFSFFQNAGA